MSFVRASSDLDASGLVEGSHVQDRRGDSTSCSGLLETLSRPTVFQIDSVLSFHSTE